MERNYRGITRTVRLCRQGFLREVLATALVCGLGSSLAAPAGAQPPAGAQRATVSGLPLNFEPNLGQAGSDVQFLAHGSGYSIALTGQGAELALGKAKTNTNAKGTIYAPDRVRLRVLGARSEIKPTAEEPLPGRINYYIGNDRSKWLNNVATYGKVRYAGVYPGVDLLYYGTQGKLEYDFAVAPGASARAIGLNFEGAQGLHVDAQGNLKIRAHGREIAFERPIAYQQIGARRVPVQASYRLSGNAIHFKVGAYDHRQRLIIDPILSYFSYLGGSGYDVVGALTPTGGPPSNSTASQAAAVDSAGDLYVTGQTGSTDFPTKAAFASPPTKLNAGSSWAFVTKFAPDAKSLIFSTYIGGSLGHDYGYGIAVDASGSAFVVGQTDNNDFPITTGAYQSLCSPAWYNNTAFASSCTGSIGYGTGPPSAFVAKFSPSGALLDSTFLGGTATQSVAYAVAVDSVGRPYVAGWAYPGRFSPTGCGGYNPQLGFPTTAGAVVSAYIDSCPNNNANLNLQDAFVSVFDPTLSTLIYSTLLGDARPYFAPVPPVVHNSYGTAVTVDPSGNFYLAGWTSSGYLAVTPGALQTAPASCVGLLAAPDNNLSGNCGFVAKFSPVGGTNPPALTYSTYLGHMSNCCGSQFVSALAVDAAGDAYVAGFASQGGFPITTGAYQSTCTASCATSSSVEFIAELNPSGTQLLHSTYFGDLTGSGDAVAFTGPMALDAAGNVYISGTGADGLPQVNALGTSNGGGGAISPFVAEFDPTLSTLKFSSLLSIGGQSQLSVDGLALDTSGNIYLAGNVNSPPSSAATAGVFQASYGGGTSDGFVAKIIPTVPTTTTLTASPTTATTGVTITFVATVAENPGTAVPTGTVTFKDGSTTLGTGTANGTGVAMYTTTSLAVGAHSVTAVYGGDSGDSGSTSSAVIVTITAPMPTVTIGIVPTTITVGQTATLTWSSTNATACTASGAWSGNEAVSGTLSVTPTAAGSLTYGLACTGAGGAANGSVTLTVNAPAAPTVTISVAPTTLTVGQSATLTWSSTNTTSCTATGAWSGTQAVSGSQNVTPAAAGTETFNLACTGAGGTANASANLTINAAAKSSGGGGGGAFGVWEVIALAGMSLARRRTRAKA